VSSSISSDSVFPLSKCEAAELRRRSKRSFLALAVSIAATGIASITSIILFGAWALGALALILLIGSIFWIRFMSWDRSSQELRVVSLPRGEAESFEAAVAAVNVVAPGCVVVDESLRLVRGITAASWRSVGQRVILQVDSMPCGGSRTSIKSENVVDRHYGSLRDHQRNIARIAAFIEA
jgi:hypothetical protein